jgi:cephalosporin hydroxylase
MTQAELDFHEWYYSDPSRLITTWLGVPLRKIPNDLWVYAELIQRVQPRWIIETGTLEGGSALWFAQVGALAGARMQVITIDLEARPNQPTHSAIEYVVGNSLDPAIQAHVRMRLGWFPGPVLVSLDSDHTAAHVLAELRAYSPFVTPGSYLVVEDTNLAYEAVPGWGPSPRDAVQQWFAEDHPPFEVDYACERYGLTFSPQGWLRRVG